jgi:uncharacterized protein (DUF488 family)
MGHLFSIGHGNKKIEDFIRELQSFDVRFVIDIRSKPFSKWNIDFNQSTLMQMIKNQDIKYAY